MGRPAVVWGSAIPSALPSGLLNPGGVPAGGGRPARVAAGEPLRSARCSGRSGRGARAFGTLVAPAGTWERPLTPPSGCGALGRRREPSFPVPGGPTS